MFLSSFLNSASDTVPSFNPSLAFSSCAFCFASLSLVPFNISFSCVCLLRHSSKFELSYLRFALIALRSLCCSLKSLFISFISCSKSLPSKLSFMLIPLTVSAINTHPPFIVKINQCLFVSLFLEHHYLTLFLIQYLLILHKHQYRCTLHL